VRDWGDIVRHVEERRVWGFFLHPNPAISLLTTATAAIVAATAAAVLLTAVCACPLRLRFGSAAIRAAALSLRSGGPGSLLVAYLIHWLPYLTQERQTFLLYYLPAYYFAILLTARTWHDVVCCQLPDALAAVLTLLLCSATGVVSWRLLPICFASKVNLHEWAASLRLASTECWHVLDVWEPSGAPCWVDHV
tara:strand:+ start:1329 stop:1907 length:579 start_codon:yes stop_codon:yes gene_type:complete